MPPGDSPQTPVRPVETPLLSELRGYLEETTAQTLRQVARQASLDPGDGIDL